MSVRDILWIQLVISCVGLCVSAWTLRDAWHNHLACKADPAHSGERIVARGDLIGEAGRVIAHAFIVILSTIVLMAVLSNRSTLVLLRISVLIGITTVLAVNSINSLLTRWKLARFFQAMDHIEAVQRVVWATVAELIVSNDAAGIIRDASAPAGKMFGYAHADLIGRHVDDLVPHDLRTTHAAHRADYAMHPRLRPMGQEGSTIRGRRRNGTTFPVAIQLCPATIRGESCVLAIIADMTKWVDNGVK
jgi:PAS domain S-box-containing protein